MQNGAYIHMTYDETLCAGHTKESKKITSNNQHLSHACASFIAFERIYKMTFSLSFSSNFSLTLFFSLTLTLSVSFSHSLSLFPSLSHSFRLSQPYLFSSGSIFILISREKKFLSQAMQNLCYEEMHSRKISYGNCCHFSFNRMLLNGCILMAITKLYVCV